jgi:hypothetical protein
MLRVLVIILAWPTVAVAQSEQLKAEIIAGIIRDCTVRQRAAPMNKAVTNENVVLYCKCIANHVFEILSFEEMQKTADPPVPESIQKKMNMLGAACTTQLR